MQIFGVILAGGSGSRLWPLSRDLVPKHLVKIDHHLTFFQSTMVLTLSVIEKDHILIATNIKLESDLKTQIRELNEEITPQFLLEPICKNTAPAVTLAALSILRKLRETHALSPEKLLEEDAIMFLTPADYSLSSSHGFKNIFTHCIQLAEEGKIVTLGVKPSCINTGYGYIQTDHPSSNSFGYHVRQFIEKPDYQAAKQYVESGNYYWNTGIYIAKISTILAEIKKYKPNMYQLLTEISQANTISFDLYHQLEDISFDYAVMEKTNKAIMVELKLDFCDWGSWDSIYHASDKNLHNTVLKGNVIDLESKNSFIYSTGKLVTTLGLQNITLVETEDALLVCDSARTQEIPHLYDKVKQAGHEAFKTRQTMYRPWGYYTVLHEAEGFKVKILTINPGEKLSLQLHHHRSEHWTIVSGTALVSKGDQEYYLKQGNSIDIPQAVKHSVENPGKTILQIVEVQTGEYLGEDDIIRFKDRYGRL